MFYILFGIVGFMCGGFLGLVAGLVGAHVLNLILLAIINND